MKSRIVGNIKIDVDRELCIGAASCVTLAPNTFVIDHEGKVDLLAGNWDDFAAIQAAADSCPVRAITVTRLESANERLAIEHADTLIVDRSPDSRQMDTSAEPRTQMAIKQLKTVMDPELGINVIDLGLVYGIAWHNDNIVVSMTLTTPGCPLINEFIQSTRAALTHIPGVNEIIVDLTFDPPWTPTMMSQEAAEELGFRF